MNHNMIQMFLSYCRDRNEVYIWESGSKRIQKNQAVLETAQSREGKSMLIVVLVRIAFQGILSMENFDKDNDDDDDDDN